MQVTFLGTSDGHTSATRQHSGILIETKESCLLFDCGADSAQYLLRKKINPDFPEIIWISHMHSDHVGNLGSLVQSLWLRKRQAPLHICAPARIVPVLKKWLADCLLFPDLMPFPIHWYALKPGKKVTISRFGLVPFSTKHLANLASAFKPQFPGVSFDCFGALLQYRGKNYVYSADLADPDELRPMLKDPVEALFCEMAHFLPADLFREIAPFNIKTLCITHYPDELRNKERQLKTLAREEGFKGKLILMRDFARKEF